MWTELNTKERLIIAGFALALGLCAYWANTGLGLPTQEDKQYIQQASASGSTSGRRIRGGGLNGGK